MWNEFYAWAARLAPEKWAVMCCGIGIAVVAGIYIASPLLQGLYQRWQIRGRIRRLGDEVIEGARIPDGMGRALCIDYLVRNQAGVTVVAVRRYPGVIFAAENMELWVQVLKNGSHKFPNPLPELRMQVAAVKALVPDVPVTGVLLFAQGSRFPKGKPGEVLTLDELPPTACPQATGAMPGVEQGWERLRIQNNELATGETCS
jgi:hypothetical protein